MTPIDTIVYNLIDTKGGSCGIGHSCTSCPYSLWGICKKMNIHNIERIQKQRYQKAIELTPEETILEILL